MVHEEKIFQELHSDIEIKEESILELKIDAISSINLENA